MKQGLLIMVCVCFILSVCGCQTTDKSGFKPASSFSDVVGENVFQDGPMASQYKGDIYCVTLPYKFSAVILCMEQGSWAVNFPALLEYNGQKDTVPAVDWNDDGQLEMVLPTNMKGAHYLFKTHDGHGYFSPRTKKAACAWDEFYNWNLAGVVNDATDPWTKFIVNGSAEYQALFSAMERKRLNALKVLADAGTQDNLAKERREPFIKSLKMAFDVLNTAANAAWLWAGGLGHNAFYETSLYKGTTSAAQVMYGGRPWLDRAGLLAEAWKGYRADSLTTRRDVVAITTCLMDAVSPEDYETLLAKQGTIKVADAQAKAAEYAAQDAANAAASATESFSVALPAQPVELPVEPAPAPAPIAPTKVETPSSPQTPAASQGSGESWGKMENSSCWKISDKTEIKYLLPKAGCTFGGFVTIISKLQQKLGYGTESPQAVAIKIAKWEANNGNLWDNGKPQDPAPGVRVWLPISKDGGVINYGQ